METILVKAAQLVLSLSILVVLHEFGHFMFARLFKTRVEKFYLFFDPWFSIFKKRIGDTTYGIGWLPLGGYVKISGMIDESMDKEQMKQPPKPYEFRSKKAWQRLLIMLGGVMVNFLLALVIYIMVLHVWGEKYVPMENLKYGVMVDSLGQEMGLRDGDRILKVGGEDIERWERIPHDIIVNEAQTLTIERGGEVMQVSIDENIIPTLLKSEFPILPRVPFEIGELREGDPAAKAGIKPGDRIIGLNGEPIRFYDQFKKRMSAWEAGPIQMTLLREKDTVSVSLTPTGGGKIGVYPIINDQYWFEAVEVKYSLLESIPAGIAKGFQTTKSYLKQLQMLLKPKKYKAHESLGGFIKIGSIFPGEWNWQSFWNLTAFLSIILAIMNILPIPALDGGHVMFLLYEIISGKKPGDRFMEYAQMIGLILLLSLLLYANLNDVIGLFNK